MPDKYDFDIWVFLHLKEFMTEFSVMVWSLLDDEYQFKIEMTVSHWMKKNISSSTATGG